MYIFALTQAMLPLLKAASTPDDPARVTNTGSVDDLWAPGLGANDFSHSAGKAAVHLLTWQLAGTLAPDILVNVFAPGLFESKTTAGVLGLGTDAVAGQIRPRRIGRPGWNSVRMPGWRRSARLQSRHYATGCKIALVSLR